MVEKKKKIIKKKPAPKKKKVAADLPARQAGLALPISPPLPPPPLPVKPPKVKKEVGPRYYGTGRRKEAVARVWLRPGTGSITVNGRPYLEYFCGRKVLEFQVNRPLAVTQLTDKYDVAAQAQGGGIPGQAGAVTMGIARALVQMNPDLRTTLKKEGLLRRDPRMKERKKYGLKRARKAFQYTKR